MGLSGQFLVSGHNFIFLPYSVHDDCSDLLIFDITLGFLVLFDKLADLMHLKHVGIFVVLLQNSLSGASLVQQGSQEGLLKVFYVTVVIVVPEGYRIQSVRYRV